MHYKIHFINIIKQFKHSDATLVDLLNDVKNKLEKMQAGEEKLQNEIEDIQAGQKMMQKEMKSLAKNGINMNGKFLCLCYVITNLQ